MKSCMFPSMYLLKLHPYSSVWLSMQICNHFFIECWTIWFRHDRNESSSDVLIFDWKTGRTQEEEVQMKNGHIVHFVIHKEIKEAYAENTDQFDRITYCIYIQSTIQLTNLLPIELQCIIQNHEEISLQPNQRQLITSGNKSSVMQFIVCSKGLISSSTKECWSCLDSILWSMAMDFRSSSFENNAKEWFQWTNCYAPLSRENFGKHEMIVTCMLDWFFLGCGVRKQKISWSIGFNNVYTVLVDQSYALEIGISGWWFWLSSDCSD